MPEAQSSAGGDERVVAAPKLVSHDLYAGNPLLGEALYFRLYLPERWDLAAGVSRPEVAATHERKHKIWVANGDAWYVIYDAERRWAFEFNVRIRAPRKWNPKPPSGSLFAGGHPASVAWKDTRRGLPWKRHDVTFMTIVFNCPVTERRVELEFSGWSPRQGFEEMQEVLRSLVCH